MTGWHRGYGFEADEQRDWDVRIDRRSWQRQEANVRQMHLLTGGLLANSFVAFARFTVAWNGSRRMEDRQCGVSPLSRRRGTGVGCPGRVNGNTSTEVRS